MRALYLAQGLLFGHSVRPRCGAVKPRSAVLLARAASDLCCEPLQRAIRFPLLGAAVVRRHCGPVGPLVQALDELGEPRVLPSSIEVLAAEGGDVEEIDTVADRALYRAGIVTRPPNRLLPVA